MKRDKIVNNLTERLCSNAKSTVPIVDVFCLQAKLLPGRYNLYGNSLEFQIKYIEKKMGWMDGMVIIGHRSSKRTFGANKRENNPKNG